MTGEIDRDFYCAIFFDGYIGDCLLRPITWEIGTKRCDGCKQHKRKWLTPEQFLNECGREYPDDWAVYLICWQHREGKNSLIRSINMMGWEAATYNGAQNRVDRLKSNNAELLKEYAPKVIHNGWAIVCACTPWGKPSNDWRPE